MSKFVIEVLNARRDDGPVYLSPGVLVEEERIDEKTGATYTVRAVQVPAAGLLILTPNTLDHVTRVRLTAEQFKNFAHDLECFSEGLKGCPKQIRLEVVNVETGEQERVTYAQAKQMVEAGLNSDEVALKDQETQAAELEKLASDLEDEDSSTEDESTE